MALETISSERPFACRQPLLSDHLPSFYGRDLEVNPLGASTPSQSTFPTLTFLPVNPYARSAQATYILSLAISHITSYHRDNEAQQADVVYLDKIIQAFAMSALEQGNRDQELAWGHSCGAFSIAIRLALQLFVQVNADIQQCLMAVA